MSLYTPPNNVRFKRPPTAIEEFSAALESVNGGTTLHPEVQRQKTNMILSDIMDTADSNLEDLSKIRRYKFLDDYLLSQVTPGVVSNIMTGGQEGLLPGVLTRDELKNRYLDYTDAIMHDTETLKEIMRPILAP